MCNQQADRQFSEYEGDLSKTRAGKKSSPVTEPLILPILTTNLTAPSCACPASNVGNHKRQDSQQLGIGPPIVKYLRTACGKHSSIDVVVEGLQGR